MEDQIEEIRRLQGCINDLISVLALPALWSGREPSYMVRTLLDGLIGMLRLDFAYVRLSEAIDGSPVEMVRLAERRNAEALSQEVGRALRLWLTDNPPHSLVVVPNPIGEGEVSITAFRLGLQDGMGVFVAASQRAEFPTKIEQLLLHVSTNQAMIGLQEARLLSQQKRAAEELEQRVAERTRQLTAVNEELRKEITERKRSEQRLATQYAITRVLADSDTLAAATPHLLETIGESMSWKWGALWIVDHEAALIRCQNIWHVPAIEATEFNAISREKAFTRGQDLPGQVWESGSPIWIDDVTQSPGYVRAPNAAKVGLRGAIAFPILLGGQTLGVIEFFSRTARHPDQEELETLSAIGSQVGQFIERKSAEKEQRKLASLVENSTDFIGIASPDGQILFINPAGQKMVGLEGDEQVRATTMVDYVVEQDQQRFQEQVLPTILREGRWEGEMRIRHFQTGAAIPMLHHTFFIKDPDSDRRLAIAAIGRDITERKRVEERLRRSEANLVEGQRISHTGSWALNVSTGEIYWSLEHYRICGLEPENFKLTVETARQVIHPDDRPFANQTFDLATQERTDSERDFRIVRPDGTIRYIHSLAHPVFNESGDLTEYVGTIIDITERKLAEEVLRVAQAELAHVTRVTTLGEMTASIAHEVNQPLAAIVTNGQACLRLLARDTPDLEGIHEAVEAMISDGLRASEVIKRIRSLLKKTAPEKTPLNINEIIQEVLALAKRELIKNQILLRTELADDLPPVGGDRVQLQQVLLNLLLNANDAMRAEGWQPRELLIRSQASKPNQVEVAVRDSGRGLDPQDYEQIFDAFFTTKSRDGGLGLGLSISRTIIEAHGGRLWARANEGLGTTFQFTLPMSDGCKE